MPVSRPVLAVLVAWNSERLLQRALASLPEVVRAVVVDNASEDGSAEVAERAGATVVRSKTNLGFGPACNLGASSGPAPASEAILFLNPDAELVDGESAVDALLSELRSDASIAAVVPALEGDGQEVFQLRRLPTLGSLAREAFLVNRVWPRNPGLLRERYLDRPRDVPFDVEQPAAAALLVRRDVFESLSGFDPAFVPAWFEDVDLCARIRDRGLRVRFVPSARATHAGGTTMKALPYDDFLPLYTRNLLRYLERHASFPARVSARGGLLVGALLRLLLVSCGVKSNHARAAAVSAHFRVARGLLGLGWKTALVPGS